MPRHLLDKIRVQQFDRGNFRVDAQFYEMLVDQRGDLFANACEIDGVVLKPLLGHAHQIAQPPRRSAIPMRGSAGQDEVEAHQELLKIDLEVRSRLDWFHRIHGLMDHSNLFVRTTECAGEERLDIAHTEPLEMLEQPAIAFFENGQFRGQILQPGLKVRKVLAGVDFQRVGEVVGEANVVDDKPALFALRHPVHAGDSLEQVVLFQSLVDVHDLLDRGIEARQKHVAHDEEGDAGVDLIIVIKIERLAEILDRVPVPRLLAGGGDFCGLVGRVRRHHDRHLRKPIRRIRSASCSGFARSASSRSFKA